MPLYTFRCPKGHEHEALLKLSDIDKARFCPAQLDKDSAAPRECGELTDRMPSVNAKLFPGADSWRK